MTRLKSVAHGLVLDACAIVRLFKCGALARLEGLSNFHVAEQVAKEIRRGSSEQVTAFAGLGAVRHSVNPAAKEWDDFARLRGSICSTVDLGEAESIAICVAQARSGKFLPLVTFDNGAAKIAAAEQVPTLDFLTLLAWMTKNKKISTEETDEIERFAGERNGWERPGGYVGMTPLEVNARCKRSDEAILAWRDRLVRRKSKGRRLP